MNILFIGYWGVNDGLTQATILPHLKVLSSFDDVGEIIFTSIERELEYFEFQLDIPKVKHLPLLSKNYRLLYFNKFSDFSQFSRQLVEITKLYLIDNIICRGALAGALGYRIWKKTRIPFLVESFEPHADYMIASKTWRKWGLRYMLQKHWEIKQKENARALFPVSYNYRDQLCSEGVEKEKIRVMPCEVDLMRFKFDSKKRAQKRSVLKIEKETIVGIYTGKFGDIYLKDEAFDLFVSASQYFQNHFYLVILSPQDPIWVRKELEIRGFPLNRLCVRKVLHHEVPSWLFAADFAFSTVRPSFHRRFCSPIKNGEYWAAGLPVMIPDGIGDDSEILKKTGLGVIVGDFKNPLSSFREIEKLIKANKRSEIRKLALQHRNPNLIAIAYKQALGLQDQSVLYDLKFSNKPNQ